MKGYIVEKVNPETAERENHYFILTLDTITGRNVLVEVNKDVYDAYMQAEWREAKQAERAKKCRLADGTRCKGDCDRCKLVAGESYSMEEILETGIPTISPKKQREEIRSDFDVLANLSTAHTNRVLVDLLAGLVGEERILVEDYVRKVSQEETAAKLGCSQKTVSNHRKAVFDKLRKMLTENEF